MIVLWSSQEWKSEIKLLQICPHHGDALLDGNAHSVRYGEMIHDGSGQPDSANYQEEADSETFVMK